MNRLIFFILFALYLFSTDSYGQLVEIDHPAMNNIDIENYEENKWKNENGNYTYEYELDDGAKIKIGEFVDIEGDSVYSKKTSYPNSPFAYYSSY